jgi:hypothetical protein
MNRLQRPVVVPVVLLTLAVLVSGCTDSSTESTTTGTGSPAGTSAPAPAATSPSASTRSGTPESGATADYRLINPAVEYDVLQPGRYALSPIGPNSRPLAVVDVPEGFISSGPFLFPVGEGTHEGKVEGCCIVAYWTVTDVYKDPCTPKGGATDPGPSVEDLVRAFTGQRLTTTTRPKPVRIAGYDGVYLELTAPAHLDLAACTDHSIDDWESAPNGTRYIETSGAAVDRLWILGVAGERVVLDAGVAPGVGKKQIQQLSDIVESAHFQG